jgi:hypothetical protein
MTETAYLTLKEAAAKMRKSERWLWGWLDKHPRDRFDRPYYHLAGRTKLLSESDVARIVQDLPCPSSSDRPAPVKRRTLKSGDATSASPWNEAAALTGDRSLCESSPSSKAPSNVVNIRRSQNGRTHQPS